MERRGERVRRRRGEQESMAWSFVPQPAGNERLATQTPDKVRARLASSDVSVQAEAIHIFGSQISRKSSVKPVSKGSPEMDSRFSNTSTTWPGR